MGKSQQVALRESKLVGVFFVVSAFVVTNEADINGGKKREDERLD